MVVTKLDTPKSDYRERTGTKWLVLGLSWGRLGLGLVLELVIRVSFSVNSNPNPNLALKLTTQFQYFLGNLILEYPV